MHSPNTLRNDHNNADRTFSVIIIFIHSLPVNGNSHLDRILGEPSFDWCIIVTITLMLGADTRSIAPPIPLTNLPYH